MKQRIKYFDTGDWANGGYLKQAEKLLKNLIFSDYPFFNSSEKFSIFNTATKLIKNHDNDFLRMLILLKRRFLIKQNIFC